MIASARRAFGGMNKVVSIFTYSIHIVNAAKSCIHISGVAKCDMFYLA
jgi:hypothetical protein